jgi:periplasmic glucans biosynthesis protein
VPTANKEAPVRRRDVLRLSASLPLVLSRGAGAAAADTPPDAQDAPFDADSVAALARQLAAQPFKPPNATLPDQLKNLDYSAYQTIRFKMDHALWTGQGLNFTAAFFHRGYLYQDRVDLFEVANGRATPIRYSSDLFTWDKLKPPTEDIGFAGFRLSFPLNRLDYFDEVCTFLGASYFRAVARGQGYGLSARGLAIKTADSSGEEFPLFRSFWLERPAPGADTITIHALLDSQSTTGAYRFVIRPGQETLFDTAVTLYPRVDIAQAGLAPLTSMFFFAPNDRGNTDDWRAAVHDTSGLALHTGHDERIWRPLINPRNLQISAFSDTGPRGFGLSQRDRAFVDYEDLEARYEKRPSLWIEPQGDWGQGVVELVEIPSDREVNDNIVAFWRPHDPLKAKSESKLAYRMHWCWAEAEPGPFAKVVQTRCGKSFNGTNRQFVIDFAGAALDAWTAEAPPASDIGTDKGKIVNAVVERNPILGGWRVSIELDTQKQNVVELHARLMDGDKALTETWIARWTS